MTNLMFTVFTAVPIFVLCGVVLWATPWNIRNRYWGAVVYAVMVVAGISSFMAFIMLLVEART